ncbi:nucleotide sugar dehydrogenase [Myriangium duriaei CBS 260.36]|uniref:UDP-glucose 6-dehydrogenase n=1 Tax=Myriangium duriaei CBS 260.36 TaxID=1168546 RepID=A0A9P4MI04_9PEZI|nr:nucleotide sugar dehydrogenase [Myriangium duriaei CBS 260.36]
MSSTASSSPRSEFSHNGSAFGTPFTPYSPQIGTDSPKDYFGKVLFRPSVAPVVRSCVPRHSIKNICCIGAGYVGGPTAAVIALKNPSITVNVVDLNEARIRQWNSKHLPVHEPGLIDIVRIARNGVKLTPDSGDQSEGLSQPRDGDRLPNLFFTTEVQKCVAQADIIFMSVNTPTKETGIGAGAATNLVALEGATSSIAAWAKPGAIIVEKSTVPCRTAQMVRQTLDLCRPGVPFEVLSNPEFLAEGTAVKNLLNPDRILIGSTRTPEGLAAAAALKGVYGAWVDEERIITVNIWSSELAKLVANAMLAQRVSSINSISAICEATGADIREIAMAVGKDTRLGSKFLKAGLGFGGSCFQKDILNLVYMARTLHLDEVAEYWMQVLKMNEYQRNRFVRQVVKKLNSSLIGKKLSVMGWAFKEDSNDTRESPAIEVVKSLLNESPKEIVIFDPGCNPQSIYDDVRRLIAPHFPGRDLIHPEGPIRAATDSLDACRDAHAVLLLTPWDHFRWPAKPLKPAAFYENATGQQDKIEDHIAGITAKFETIAASDHETYAQELDCLEGCGECSRDHKAYRASCTNVPWDQIAKIVRRPGLVFDARGVVDVKAMEKLGFNVEVIGSVDSHSSLIGYDIRYTKH